MVVMPIRSQTISGILRRASTGMFLAFASSLRPAEVHMDSASSSGVNITDRARWWRWEGDRVACTLCPRACKVKAGQRAFCFSRKATEEGMALTDYGRSWRLGPTAS